MRRHFPWSIMDFFHPYFYMVLQIWGQSNQSFSKMEKLQNKALRIINFKPLRYSVNSLYNKCEILKFHHHSFNVSVPLKVGRTANLVIVLSYQIFYMHMIILRVICQQPCVLVLQFWTVNTQITRNQKGNQVNIPVVRTKTSDAKVNL